MEVGKIEVEPSFYWRVNFDSFQGKQMGDTLDSPIFITNGAHHCKNKWCLRLYPKGINQDTDGYLSLYLRNCGLEDVTATFSLSLLNENNSKTEVYKNPQNHLFSAKDYGKISSVGYPQFVLESFITDLNNNILKDNKLTFVCYVITECKKPSNVQKDENDKPSASMKLLVNYEQLFANKEFSDVTIMAEGKSFDLHKCILTSQSIVFERMFKNDMKEKNQSVVEIEDVRYKVLQELFRFVYTGKVSPKAKNIVCDLLTAAEKYCIEGLKELCGDMMACNLDSDNAINYLSLAVMNNAKKLESDVIVYISSHVNYFSRKEEFDEFGCKNPKVLLKIIQTFITD